MYTLQDKRARLKSERDPMTFVTPHGLSYVVSLTVDNTTIFRVHLFVLSLLQGKAMAIRHATTAVEAQ